MVICGFLNRGKQTNSKKIFFQVEKFMEIMFHILKNASECQMGVIFAIKNFLLLGPKSRKCYPRFIDPFNITNCQKKLMRIVHGFVQGSKVHEATFKRRHVKKKKRSFYNVQRKQHSVMRKEH